MESPRHRLASGTISETYVPSGKKIPRRYSLKNVMVPVLIRDSGKDMSVNIVVVLDLGALFTSNYFQALPE